MSPSLPMRRTARRATAVRLVSMAVGIAVAFTLGLAPVSTADTRGDKKKLDADIALLRTQLEDTSKDLANAFIELHRTRAELPGAEQALAAADAARVVADRHNEEVATALAIAQANEAKAADQLAQIARDTQAAQDQLGNMARDAYQQGGDSGLAIALEATSPEDFTNRLVMMDTVMRVRSATLRGLDTMRAEGKAGQAHLVAVRQQVAQLKVQAEAALTQATTARQIAAAAKTKLDLLYAAQTRYAATVAAKKATEITNLTKMQSRSEALGRVLAARAKAAREKAARATAARDDAARAAHRPVPHTPPHRSQSRFISATVPPTGASPVPRHVRHTPVTARRDDPHAWPHPLARPAPPSPPPRWLLATRPPPALSVPATLVPCAGAPPPLSSRCTRALPGCRALLCARCRCLRRPWRRSRRSSTWRSFMARSPRERTRRRATSTSWWLGRTCC